MSVPPGGFPFAGAPGGMPGAAPGYPGGQQAAPAQWVLDVPPDPTWEPIESSDTLEKDGYYAAKIVGEKIRQQDNGGKIDIIMTLELHDDDVKGKKIARFMPDPRLTKGDTWFLWRGLMRSITNQIDTARAGFRYTPGQLTGQYVYVKTEAYADDKGNQRTGVASWVTQAEWMEAVKANKHRWAPVVRQSGPGNAAGAGALPPGLPGNFPGLPGAPSSPGGMPAPPTSAGFPGAPPQITPQPSGPPMQAPAAPGFAAPPTAAGFPGAPPPMGAAPPAPGGFMLPTAPTAPMAPPPNGATTPQPPPSVSGLAASFPGMGQPPQ